MNASNGSGPSRGPAEIRRDIEQTREELARTAAALAERADVKARAQEKVAETRARITGKAHDARAKAAEATPDAVAHNAGQAAGQIAGTMRRNPLPAGVLVGYLIASRRARSRAFWER